VARILITSALPYINGVKHMGNLAGSMLPADVYARAMRLLGHDVLYICATDEHGTPAELAAQQAGIEVADYCDAMHEAQAAAGANFKLSYDYFGRSNTDGSPREGFEDKVFYVWFDAPIAYIASTQDWAAFHTLSFPTTLIGSGEPWKLVDSLKAFNWVTWYGGKFSTSQKRGVFMDQAIDIAPSDNSDNKIHGEQI